MEKRKRVFSAAAFVLLVFASTLFLSPIFIVLMNSFKTKFNIISAPFDLPNSSTFAGLENYVNGIASSGIAPAFLRSLFITVFSVVVIVVCSAMSAWYIVRVKTRFTKLMYYLFVFSMIVPFQMVMLTT